jgi:hypothetical protein
MGRVNGLMILGVIFLVAGLAGFAIPVFTTQKTEDVAKIGDIKIQSTENTPHIIPPLLSGGAMALGVLLIGVGLYQKR